MSLRVTYDTAAEQQGIDDINDAIPNVAVAIIIYEYAHGETVLLASIQAFAKAYQTLDDYVRICGWGFRYSS